MNFVEAIKSILLSANKAMTPQEIRERIIKDFPEFYGTESQTRNVEKGHYKDLDHALLARIYTATGYNKSLFSYDRKYKPIRISLLTEQSPLLQKNGPKVFNQEKGRIFKSAQLISYRGKRTQIIENLETYHQSYYQAETFFGPSLYFHQRAIEMRNLFGTKSGITRLEHIYATLSAWGMHRMGQGGSKMLDFETFSQSIESLGSLILLSHSKKSELIT